MSAASRKKLSASLRRAAARRKRLGLHKRHYHRKKMTAATRAKLSVSLRRAAARRKALHLKRHLKPATIAKLRARLAKYRHMHHRGHKWTPAQRVKMMAILRNRHQRHRHIRQQRFRHHRGVILARARKRPRVGNATHHQRFLARLHVTKFRVRKQYSMPRQRFRLVSTVMKRYRIKRVRLH